MNTLNRKAPTKALLRQLDRIRVVEDLIHALEQTHTQQLGGAKLDQAYRALAKLKQPINQELSCRQVR